MNILGISAGYHDSACALLRRGRLVCAAEEERFSRIKHDPGFPVHAFRFCLQHGEIGIRDLDAIAFYERPAAKLSRQLWMATRPGAPRGLRARVMARLDPDSVEHRIRAVTGFEGPIEYVGHHEAHAASSFFFSGFREAALLTVDGVGEWDTGSFGVGRGAHLELLETSPFPHSLGLFYSTLTSYLGFEVNEGEYKLMGLAPYGAPRYLEQLRELLDLSDEARPRLRLDYFDFLRPDRMYTDRFIERLGIPPRASESPIERVHEDLARSAQTLLEEVLLGMVRHLHRRVPVESLCMAGGVALNCVANGRIRREGPFRRLFIPPAPGDSGGALGAAALVHARRTRRRPAQKRLAEAHLGPAYTPAHIAELLASAGVQSFDLRGRLPELLDLTAERLAAGQVVAWFWGRMELGPRALGARSILADPRRPEMRDRVNALVKMREGFRPFAPAVLERQAAAHFDLDVPSPFMLETCRVRSAIPMPAITHVDGSARVQTVPEMPGNRFAALLLRFFERTGCPVLLNTSFNVRGEPLVCSPIDALLCFTRARIDVLVLEDFVLDRASIPPHWERVVESIPVRRGVSQQVYAML